MLDEKKSQYIALSGTVYTFYETKNEEKKQIKNFLPHSSFGAIFKWHNWCLWEKQKNSQ
jgi:hypothetical protein